MKKHTSGKKEEEAISSAVEEIEQDSGSLDFPVVGIGASAGGLEALQEFLENVPEDSGMAFVIVQHLDPTRKAMIADILDKCTWMEVRQAEDGTKIQRGHVYVIPPDKEMSILHGVLHLFTPSEKQSHRLPIDFFFQSLAQDREHFSIAVILSGMGSDGSLGMRAVREKGGLTLAQAPAEAKFDSMPCSVIEAGLADIIAPAAELPGRILTFLKHETTAEAWDDKRDARSRSSLDKILILLRGRAGHDFTYYKSNTLYRRIDRRMGIHQIGDMETYVRFLQENPHELDLLFKEMLIGVTSFFRDPEVWETLVKKTIPALLEERKSGMVRVWVAGCSTGEEAYSMAIVFREVLEKLEPRRDLKMQIFASDLDRSAIDLARQAMFPEAISKDVSPERLEKCFTREGHGYRLRPEIRETVIFSPHSLIMDPPFTKMDLISCRNLLIYLNHEMQAKLLPLFHYCLKPDGVLLLGSAETVGRATDLFTPLEGKLRLFRKKEADLHAGNIEFPSSFGEPRAAMLSVKRPVAVPRSLQTQVEQLIVHRYSPPSVLTNPAGDILHISGRTGNFLEPAVGKANWNVFAMARVGLRRELFTAFQKALKQEGPVIYRGLKIGSEDSGAYIDLSVEQLVEEPLGGMVMIVFTPVPPPAEKPVPDDLPPGEGRQHETDEELRGARAEVLSMRTEMQASQEDLRTIIEELQSTNEEMQSTNEELTTSKEELQSLNEELQTVNSELERKVDELSVANNDMKNLLNCTDVATLFLDNGLRVRRFTTEATKIINLIPGDVGRPITDLSADVIYPDLPEDAREVLRTLRFAEKPVTTRDGSWFSIRIMPYRTVDGRIDGVVITFMDISVAKKLEAQLRSVQDGLETKVAKQSDELKDARGTITDMENKDGGEDD